MSSKWLVLALRMPVVKTVKQLHTYRQNMTEQKNDL